MPTQPVVNSVRPLFPFAGTRENTARRIYTAEPYFWAFWQISRIFGNFCKLAVFLAIFWHISLTFGHFRHYNIRHSIEFSLFLYFRKRWSKRPWGARQTRFLELMMLFTLGAKHCTKNRLKIYQGVSRIVQYLTKVYQQLTEKSSRCTKNRLKSEPYLPYFLPNSSHICRIIFFKMSHIFICP